MIQNRYQQTSELLLVFLLFLFSNFTAFLGTIWLRHQLVLIEALLWLILAGLCIWNLRRHNSLSNYLMILKRNWIILPFFIFSGFSIFWSISRDISLYRWLILLFTIVAGGYIGLRYNLQEIIESLSSFGLWVIFLSLILVLFMPYIGVMNYHIIQGAWKGIYWHKNHMGLIASFVSILLLINIINSFRLKEKYKFAWVILYLFSLLFIFQTDSVAAYITTLFTNGGIVLALIWLKFKKAIKKYHYIFFIIILIFILLILYINIDRFLGIFNRNTTLTGRLPMWSFLYNTYIIKRPIGGYGFNAFWYIDANRIAIQQAAGYPDPIVIADNGFIDILVNTGFIGLFLFSIFYIGAWWRSIKFAWKANSINGFFPLVLLSFTLIANISWSLIFENESFFMLIMITVLFFISKNEAFRETSSLTHSLVEEPIE
ncbi:MAG: O-antigen ligase family protein [Anaerolineales bacterium]